MSACSAVDEVRDLQPTELGEDVARRDHRLGDGALVEHAIDGERLGGGRRLDRQFEVGRVGAGGRCEMPGCWTAATWNRAVPALTVVAGKRTSTRSLAGTITCWPSSETCDPETFEVAQTSKV